VVVLVGLTTRLVPDPTRVPPQLPVYQSTVHPLATDADSVDDCPEVMDDGFAAGLVGALGKAFTVTDVVAHVELPHAFSHRT
jgi:hypothetical protein